MVVKRHERFKRGAAMEITGICPTVHLRAAATDILLDHQRAYGTYLQELLQAYWATASAERIIEDIEATFPLECILLIRAFCERSYPHLLVWFSC